MRSSRAVEGSLPACSAPTPQGVSASAPDCFGSTPRDGIGSSSCKGSFDCVVARFATDNFAQDDRAVRADEYHAKQNAPDSFESWDVCRSALPQVLLNHKTKRKPHIGKWLVRAITSTKVTTHGSSGTSGHSVDLPRIRPVLVDMFMIWNAQKSSGALDETSTEIGQPNDVGFEFYDDGSVAVEVEYIVSEKQWEAMEKQWEATVASAASATPKSPCRATDGLAGTVGTDKALLRERAAGGTVMNTASCQAASTELFFSDPTQAPGEASNGPSRSLE